MFTVLRQNRNSSYSYIVFHREMREEYHQLDNRENDSLAKRKDYEQRYATAESEIASLKNDLRLALQRIADLQQALEEGDDDESSDR